MKGTPSTNVHYKWTPTNCSFHRQPSTDKISNIANRTWTKCGRTIRIGCRCRNMCNLFSVGSTMFVYKYRYRYIYRSHIRIDVAFDGPQNIVCVLLLIGVCACARAPTNYQSRMSLLSILACGRTECQVFRWAGLNPYKCTVARYIIWTVGQCKWTVYYVWFSQLVHTRDRDRVCAQCYVWHKEMSCTSRTVCSEKREWKWFIALIPSMCCWCCERERCHVRILEVLVEPPSKRWRCSTEHLLILMILLLNLQ